MHEQYAPMSGGPDSTRRGFLAWSIGGISAALTALLAWPMVGSLVGPIFRKAALRYSRLEPLSDIAIGHPVKVRFPFVQEDAFLRVQEDQEVWVVRKDPDNLVVFSPICPHLGCRVDWHPGMKAFLCPCHGSVFSESGEVQGGPSPRPLDTLPSKVVNGDLMVELERFKVGVPEKVRA